MATLCAITGSVKTPSGADVTSTDITFRKQSGVVGDGLTIVPSIVTTTTDGSGDISVSLYPGTYEGRVVVDERVERFHVTVPTETSALFEDLIAQSPALTPTLATELRELAGSAQVAVASVLALPRWITRTRIVTSGAASYQWDDIPASATALRVTFGDHSLGAGGGDLFVRLGIASGIEATGYDAVSGTTAYTTAFVAPEGNANRRFTGALELDLVDPATNTWAGKFNGVLSVPSVVNGGGSKALAGPLTTVQIVASAGVHDGGHAVLSYLAVA